MRKIYLSVFVLALLPLITGCTNQSENTQSTSAQSQSTPTSVDSWISPQFTGNSDSTVAYKWTSSAPYSQQDTCFIFSGNGSTCYAVLVEVKTACTVTAQFSTFDKNGILLDTISQGHYAALSAPVYVSPGQKGLILFSVNSQVKRVQITSLGCS